MRRSAPSKITSKKEPTPAAVATGQEMRREREGRKNEEEGRGRGGGREEERGGPLPIALSWKGAVSGRTSGHVTVWRSRVNRRCGKESSWSYSRSWTCASSTACWTASGLRRARLQGLAGNVEAHIRGLKSIL